MTSRETEKGPRQMQQNSDPGKETINKKGRTKEYFPLTPGVRGLTWSIFHRTLKTKWSETKNNRFSSVYNQDAQPDIPSPIIAPTPEVIETPGTTAVDVVENVG